MFILKPQVSKGQTKHDDKLVATKGLPLTFWSDFKMLWNPLAWIPTPTPECCFKQPNSLYLGPFLGGYFGTWKGKGKVWGDDHASQDLAAYKHFKMAIASLLQPEVSYHN